MWNVGPIEMIVIIVVVLLIFGPKSLPKIGHAIGRGIREFKDASAGITKAFEEEVKEDQNKNSAQTQNQSQPQIQPNASSQAQQEQKDSNIEDFDNKQEK